MSLTKQRDTDLLVLLKLDDEALFKICQTNRYFKNLCNNESFWYTRFLSRFGEERGRAAIFRKPDNLSFKNYYLQIIIDLNRFSKDPMYFFRDIYWSENGFNESLYGDNVNFLKPLSEAPSWIINNLYLLDLGKELYIWNRTRKHFDLYSNVTPIELLRLISPHTFTEELKQDYPKTIYNSYINGFDFDKTNFYRSSITLIHK